jgi:oligopeptide transport system substrate-binding protein
MGSKRFLFLFGMVGGLASGLLGAALLDLLHWGRLPWQSYLLLATVNAAGFFVGGSLIWLRWSERRQRARAEVVAQLAQGNLATHVTQGEGQEDVRRLILSLRRALFQVQRVTANVQRTGKGVGEQSRSLLEAARRQGAAVERSLGSVQGMGESLQVAGQRLTQVQAFADETTTALAEMTERIEQVASALGTLDSFAQRTTERVQVMSEGLSAVASSGDVLARFAREAAAFVASVEDGIDAVRRRARETGELARVVTATAQRGEALVNDSVQGMYRVEESIRRAAEIVDALGQRSQEIGRIVDVIQEVADQTNLLSLNAAIIAAQAGEQGRPFGVVAEEIRSLAERTARSTREIAAIIRQTRGHVDAAVVHVKEGRERATAGVALGDRAASSLKEIRATTQRTFAAVEATVAETGRLETQGTHVVQASQRVAGRVVELTRASVEQADAGRELVRQTQEMARLAQGASAKAEGQARTGRALSDAVRRLTDAIDEIRAAHAVLTRGDAAISEDVAQVRNDAETVLRIGDGLSRSVDQLSREAASLEAEVFRFRLPGPRRGGTLRVGIHQSAMFESTRGLDPLFTLDNQMVEIGAGIYAGLLRQEDGVMLPDLAERWEAAPSARSYRFFLRPRLAFHDGVPLRSGDVKRHFERLLDPALDSPDQWIFKEVEGAKDFLAGRTQSVSGFETPDELTLEIRLEEPKAFFLHLVTLPATLVTRVRPDGRLVGAGPYRPVSMDASGVILERHPGYFRPERPFLDRLEFRFHRDRAEAIQRLREGAVDVVSGLYAENVRDAGLDPQQVIAGTQPSCWFMGFHVRTPPFDDLRVRLGIRAGLDVASMVERFHPGAHVASTLTPPSLLTGEMPPPPRPNLALARQLLGDAGTGRLRLKLLYPPGRNTEAEDAMLFRPLVEAGLVELEHGEIDPAEFWGRVREGRLSIFRAGWIADYPDADNFLHFLLNSGAQTVFGLGYRSAELDRLTTAARVSIDPETRMNLYRSAERIVVQECPVIPLYHERIYAAASPRVQGLRLHPTPPQVRFEELWLDSADV